MTANQKSVGAVVIGLGHHGTRIARLAAEAGVWIVGAADPRHAGADLGELAGTPLLTGVTVVAGFEALGAELDDAQLAILAVEASIDELVELELHCVRRDLNVISIIVAGFDIDEIPADLRAELERAAKEHDVTVVATGSQDVSWGGMLAYASAQVRGLTSASLTNIIGIDGYPRAFVDTIGATLSREEFERSIAGGAGEEFSIGGATVTAVAKKLGLTATATVQTIEPVVRDVPVFSETYGRDIPPGAVIGMRDTVTIRTAEGIDVTAVFEVIARPPGAEDSTRVHLEGDPVVDLEQRSTNPPDTVDATVINRIPDVLSAPAGLVSAFALPLAHYRAVLGAAEE